LSSTLFSLNRAGRWFLESGIQEAGGGVARYYHSDQGRNAGVSTEITGYAVSTLVYLHRRTERRDYLEAARRAADFLITEAWNPSSAVFPFELSLNGAGPAPAYFFDSGIIVRGLLSIWRVTGDSRYLDVAVECGRSMIRDFAAGAEIHPVLALPEKRPLEWEQRWSRHPGCYQLKAALAWHELSAATGDREFERCYEGAAAQALASHGTFLAGEPDREKVMDRLHAYAYFLEGLLPAAARPECAAALREGIARAAAGLRAIAPLFERSDVYAQILRVRVYCAALGVATVDRAAAEHEAAKAAEFQFEDTDPRIRDGFWFGRKAAGLLPFVNPVSTAFCAQALDMWRQHEAGEFYPEIECLI
jgi:hypothetical protein